MKTSSIITLPLSALVVFTAAIGCRSKPPPPEPEPVVPATSAPTTAANATATTNTSPVVSGGAVTAQDGSGAALAATSTPIPGGTTTGARPNEDPAQGKFTLEDATRGLPKTDKLFAEIVTDQGKLKCEMYEDKAPNTVANFVGLARGLRPFKDPKTGVWVKRPGYDDGVFHRIIKGFMIQGGDPTGTGATDGGYVIPDEVWPGATHDRRGLICMANRGKNTNSMQFFIMDGAAKHLDGGYTIFGSCGPDAVIEKLAASEVRGDRAVSPPKIKQVTVRRGK
jgi:peptidyl-prolyl cis-trans isomerase A (cyclophilin A)